MTQKDKTKEEFIEEIKLLQKRIAELETADTESKQQQRRLAMVVRDSNDAITLRDFDGQITTWNHGAELMYGYSKEEALQMNIRRFTPPDKETEHTEFVRRLMGGETVSSFETQRVAKDGRILDVWLTVTKVLDDMGKPIGIATTERDITERKRLEKTLQESEEFSRRVIDSSKDCIKVLDLQGHLLSMSSGGQKLLEIDDIKPYLNKSWADFWKGKDREGALEAIAKARRGDAGIFTGYCETEKGTPKWWEIIVTPIKDAHGNVERLLALSRDITKRKEDEAEREIALKQQQDINILQHLLLAPAVLQNKLKTITDSIVRIFDADFCRIWLIRPGDLCEKGCIHAEVKEGPHVCRYREKCLHLMASSGRYTHIDGKGHARVPFDCYKIGRIASGEDNKFLTNDVVNDPRVHNHEWARELDLVSFVGYQLKIPGGETIGVLALFAKHPITVTEDAALDSFSVAAAFVTQQAALEEELANAYAGLEDKVRERTRELNAVQDKLIRSEKLAALGKLAGIVGHELRNPLGAIRNSVYFLRLKLDTASQDEKIKRHLEMMDQEINNSDRIISDILFFSRVKQSIVTQNNLNEILKASLKKVIINLNIKVETELAELPLIPSDENQLVQVFTNIILNAAESMPKGGKLTISSFVKQDRDFINVSIKDTGEGISKENLLKLFEPLFSTKINGTGLGMVVCKSIIENHKGYIGVESEKGKGTLVTVELPIKQT